MKERIEKRIKELEIEMQSLQVARNQHQKIINDYQKSVINTTNTILLKQGELIGLKGLLVEETDDTDGKTNK